MADRIVVNTGPLIALSSADALEVAAQLPFEFISPLQVRDELEQGIAMDFPRSIHRG